MVSSEEVVSYIYNNLRSGYSIIQIEQELIKEGMSKEQVEQYIEYVMDNYYQHDKGVIRNVKHHSPNGGYFFGIVGVLILFIILSIVFFSGQNTADEPIENVGEYIVDDTISDKTSNDVTDVNTSASNPQGVGLKNEDSLINSSYDNTSLVNDSYSSNNIISNDSLSVNPPTNDSVLVMPSSDSRPSIVISGDFETYERFSGTDVFNINEPKTIFYQNKSYVVTLKGLNSDAKSFILDIDGTEKTFRYGEFQTEKSLAVFNYDFVFNEPYAYVKLLFPNNGDYYLVSNKENTYLFENNFYRMQIIDSYELDNTITLSVNDIELNIENGKNAIYEDLYVRVVDLQFDNLAKAFAKLILSNTSGINGTLNFELNKTTYAKLIEPYNAKFSIEGIDVNSSKINYSVSLGSTILVNDTPLRKDTDFIINNLTYVIESLGINFTSNWTVNVKLKYS